MVFIILNTLFLDARNYTMQFLVTLSQNNVDKAKKKKKTLEINIYSREKAMFSKLRCNDLTRQMSGQQGPNNKKIVIGAITLIIILTD